MPLAEVFYLRNGLGEMNAQKGYFQFEAEQEKKMPAAPIESGSALDKVWNPGEWIDKDDAAMDSASNFQAFMVGSRGFGRGKYTVKSNRK